MHTPARIHFGRGALVRSVAEKTYVGPRLLVLYTGHMYTFAWSPSSATMARHCTTGISQNISRGKLLSRLPEGVSQCAPSMAKPCT